MNVIFLTCPHSTNTNHTYTVQLRCPMHWQQIRDKCLYFTETFKLSNDSLADCYTRESSLLRIQDHEELVNNY